MEYIVIAFSKFQKIEAVNLIIISFHGTFIVNFSIYLYISNYSNFFSLKTRFDIVI
jgi:hypothetical protein